MKYILLHGMGQNASSWDKTISFLPDGTESVCPELSDFFTEGNCFYNKMYDAFCDYCNNISEPLNLCGLSLGAILALNYANEVDLSEKGDIIRNGSEITAADKTFLLDVVDTRSKSVINLTIQFALWISKLIMAVLSVNSISTRTAGLFFGEDSTVTIGQKIAIRKTGRKFFLKMNVLL